MQGYYNHRNDEKAVTGLIYLHPEQIRTATIAPKEGQDRNAIIRISESMRRYGVLQPLSVRLITDITGFPAYELVDGARRLRAARLLGIDKLPCIVVSEGERSAAIGKSVAKLRQNGVHFLDQAIAFRRLGEDFGLTQEEIARKVGVSQSAVANKLRLLRLLPAEQTKIREAGVTERHARALLRIKSPESREAVLAEILRERMTVGQAEALIDAFLAENSAKSRGQADVSRETIGFSHLAAGENVSRETICDTDIGGAASMNGGSRDVSRETFWGAGESDASNEARFGTNTADVSRETMPLYAENGCSVSVERSASAETLGFSGSEAGHAAQASGAAAGSAVQVSGTATGSVPQVSGAELNKAPSATTAMAEKMPLGTTVMAEKTPPQGICPRKFALRDLRPLYNSIERTLSIFRKTGQDVECRRIESESGVTIIIEIPRHA